jgi:hypothetical protein
MQTADQERKKQQTPPSKPQTNRHKRSLFALFQRLSASDVQLSCIADPKCPRKTATLRILERRLFEIHSTTAAKFVPGHSCFVVSRAFAAPAEGASLRARYSASESDTYSTPLPSVRYWD